MEISNGDKHMGSSNIQIWGRNNLRKASELKDLDKKSRKTMRMYGGLHLKSDVDRLYAKRKEGGRGLISVEKCIREEENSLGFYVSNSEENLIRGVSAAETINARETITSAEFKKQCKRTKKRGVKNESTDNLSGKQRRKLIKKKGGNGYQ